MALFNWSELVSGGSNSCQIVIFLEVYHLQNAEPFVDRSSDGCVDQIYLDDIDHDNYLFIDKIKNHCELDNSNSTIGNNKVVRDHRQVVE